MNNKIKEHNLNWQVESVGTGNYNTGHPAHPLSQKVARMHGIDISRHRARQFKKEDMIDFDRIYVMDKDNYEDVKKMSHNLWNAGKTSLLLNEAFPGEDREVPDPWYSEEAVYHLVYEMMDEACNCIIKKYASTKENIILSNKY